MTTSDSPLRPNELAELYDSLIVIKQVLEDQISGDDVGPSKPYMSLWVQAISHRVSGNGWGDSPAYGEQQYRRNGISINEYREAYGNGTQVTQFEVIETVPPSDEEAAMLDISTPNDIQVPVVPDPQKKLPLVIKTEGELVEALTLLGQLPDYPDIGGSSEPSSDDTLLTLADVNRDGRIEELVVKVEEVKNSVGSKKDEILEISDVEGEPVVLTLWSKHGVASDWDTGTWYWLHNARVKVWDSSGTTERKLSTTNDLIVEALGSEVDRAHLDTLRRTHGVIIGAQAGRSPGQSTADNPGPGEEGEATSEKSKSDVVPDLMADLDFD